MQERKQEYRDFLLNYTKVPQGSKQFKRCLVYHKDNDALDLIIPDIEISGTLVDSMKIVHSHNKLTFSTFVVIVANANPNAVVTLFTTILDIGTLNE